MLYSLSVMSLLFTAAALLAMMGVSGGVVAMCIIFVPPVLICLRNCAVLDGLGLFAATWRTIALLAVCGTAFVLFLLFVIAMTLALMRAPFQD